MVITQIEDGETKEAVARGVLAALPEWFGIPEAVEEYVLTSQGLPFWAAFTEALDTFSKTGVTTETFPEERKAENTSFLEEARAGAKALGFIVLKETSPATAEIYVMGVLPEWHRKGVGRSLFEALRKYAGEKGYSFLQVKTVQEGHYPEYDRTNQFYKGVGFQELECFPTLWGEKNPCQIFVMAL